MLASTVAGLMFVLTSFNTFLNKENKKVNVGKRENLTKHKSKKHNSTYDLCNVLVSKSVQKLACALVSSLVSMLTIE